MNFFICKNKYKTSPYQASARFGHFWAKRKREKILMAHFLKHSQSWFLIVFIHRSQSIDVCILQSESVQRSHRKFTFHQISQQVRSTKKSMYSSQWPFHYLRIAPFEYGWSVGVRRSAWKRCYFRRKQEFYFPLKIHTYPHRMYLHRCSIFHLSHSFVAWSSMS